MLKTVDEGEAMRILFPVLLALAMINVQADDLTDSTADANSESVGAAPVNVFVLAGGQSTEGIGSCNFNNMCESAFFENCMNCTDCDGGVTPGAACGNGLCEAGDGENCVNCPSDCNGKQNGKPANRFCCGASGGENPVPCSDSRCDTGGFSCTETPVMPGSFCCPDTPATEACASGLDEDCDSLVDCNDPDCAVNRACCAPKGDACADDSECCSNRCKGKPGAKSCK